MKISGIYKIECILNNKVYIGQSSNIYYRWSFHKSKLRKNCHINYLLQDDYNKYGENNFRFIILEKTDIDLISKETKWINIYGGIESENTYNFLCEKNANQLFKTKISKTLKGRKVDEKTKERLRTMNIGRKMSEHTRQCLIERNQKMKDHYRKLNKGRICITNGTIDKAIRPEELEKYESQGFYRGRTKTRWHKDQK